MREVHTTTERPPGHLYSCQIICLNTFQPFLYSGEKNPPSWTMYFQVMTFAEAEALPFNPFDLTKVSHITKAHSSYIWLNTAVAYLNVFHFIYLHCNRVWFNKSTFNQVWPHADYPLHEIGRMVLDRNPQNYFAEIEQLAFAPSHLIPGKPQTCKWQRYSIRTLLTHASLHTCS